MELFHRAYPHTLGSAPVPEKKQLAKLTKKVPAQLVQLWAEHGFCGYGDGLFWTLDPTKHDHLLDEWIEDADQATILMRTAFGDLFFHAGGIFYFIETNYGGRIDKITRDAEVFFDKYLLSDRILDAVFKRPLFEKVVKKLGQLSADETYAFVPALALGGDQSPKRVQKVKFREHVAFLCGLRDA
jgi:hypothetical protein